MDYSIILSVMLMMLRIRDLREDHDYTQKFVAAEMQCDQPLYSKYERGEREIPVHLLEQLADLYGTSVDYLLCRTDDPRPYPRSKKTPFSES